MFSTPARTETFARLRGQIARIERNGAPMPHGTVPFGIEVVDTALPGGGLARGALHEFAGSGPDTEHGAAAAQFIGGVLARMAGPVLWVQQRADLFAPSLACIGLHPARILFADAGKEVLAAMEEGLAHPGLAAVVGEYTGKLTLVASRRLQLAAEQSGAMAALLRRSQTFDDPTLVEHREPLGGATRERERLVQREARASKALREVHALEPFHRDVRTTCVGDAVGDVPDHAWVAHVREDLSLTAKPVDAYAL